LPGVTGREGPLSRELTSVNGTDNQSLQAIIHNARHFSESPRPDFASAGTKAAHALLGVALLAVTFLAARRIADHRWRVVFRLGGLTIVMVAISPVNHTHYMALAVPAVLGLVYYENEARRDFTWRAGLVAVAVLHVLSGVWPRLPFLPGYLAARHLGLTMLGTLLVWWAGLTFPARRAAPAFGGAARLVGWFRHGRSRS
jgi:hypothetical protein